MPLADWNVPFLLTSQVYSPDLLPLNTLVTLPSGATGYYFVRQDGCSLRNTVRETKDNIPQFNGSILHRRFLQGLEMTLTLQLWQDQNTPGCKVEALQQEMLDVLMGYLNGLLNAVDNQGRISWSPGGGYEERMLDNLRLLVWPTEQRSGIPLELTFVVDTEYPYTEQLRQELTHLDDGDTATFTNIGNAYTYPVIQLNMNNGVPDAGSVSGTVTITGDTGTIIWLSSSPGSQLIPGGSYGEIDTFRETMFMNGDGANLTPGIDIINTMFFGLPPGTSSITITGCMCDVLWNPAWV